MGSKRVARRCRRWRPSPKILAVAATGLMTLLVLSVLLVASQGFWPLGRGWAANAEVAQAAPVALDDDELNALADWLGGATEAAAVLKHPGRGDDVRGLQAALTLVGADIGKPDGVFGHQTEDAVANFQRDQGLKVDGRVGPQTRTRLAQVVVVSLAAQHHVTRGETLGHIARRYGVALPWLADLNGLINPDKLAVDTVLMVPPTTMAAQDAFAAALALAEPATDTPLPAVAATQGGNPPPPTTEPPAAQVGDQATPPDELADPTSDRVVPPGAQTIPADNQATAPAKKPDPPAAAGAGGYALALTFNDGPDTRATPALLDLLDQNKVRATFFVTGAAAQRHEDIIRRMAQAGHQIENHGWSHESPAQLGATSMEKEIQRTAQLVAQLTGRPTTLFRPPGGGLVRAVLAAAHRQGHQILLWTNIGAESMPGVTAQQLVRWLSTPHPGAVLMLHGDNPATVAALAALLPAWREQGFQFVTLSDILP